MRSTAIRWLLFKSTATTFQAARRTDRGLSKDHLSQLLQLLKSPRDGVGRATAYYDEEVRPHIQKQLESSDNDADRSILVNFEGARSSWEEFTTLMMKTLCDARRLEDVRLLFALTLRETQKPSVEVFRALLLGISSTDTFTLEEVDNVWTIMAQREVDRDVVCDLCFLHMYLRLGKRRWVDEHWRSIAASISRTIERHSKDPLKHQLPMGFILKIPHCVTASLRIMETPECTMGLFYAVKPLTLDLIRREAHIRRNVKHNMELRSKEEEVDSWSGYTKQHSMDKKHVASPPPPLSARTLLTLFTASLANAAVKTSDLFPIFQVLTAQYECEFQGQMLLGEVLADRTAKGTGEEKSSSPPALSDVKTVTTGGVDHTASSSIASKSRGTMFASSSAISETNAFRMLARCIRDGDCTAAKVLLQYSIDHGVFSSIEFKFKFYAGVACVLAESVPRVNDAEQRFQLLSDMFDCLECASLSQDELSGTLSVVISVAATEGGSESQPAATHPIPLSSQVTRRLLASAVSTNGEQSIEEALGVLLDRQHTQRKAVTWASLTIIVDACATRLCNYSKTQAALQKVEIEFHLKESALTMELLTEALFRDESISSHSHRFAEFELLLDRMSRVHPAPIAPTAPMLRTAMQRSVQHHDTTAALRTIDLHVRWSAPLDRQVAATLIKQLCQVVDVDGVRKTLQAWRKLNGTVDPRIIRMCEAAFRRWSFACDDLAGYCQ